MDDPLTRALAEAPKKPAAPALADVTEHATEDLHALDPVMRALQDEIAGAMAVPFFDGGMEREMTPVVKNGYAELGTTCVIARKVQPAYEATVSVEVHCDHDPRRSAARDPGRYQVRARARVACWDARGVTEHLTSFAVHETAGELHIDANDLCERVAEAIRRIGKAS